ncbi:MAG TPA: vitamin B12 dependent-methionine synthase activation domain-containing protein [Bacteroidales bacterium]|nr:vitamin B12 dependent-methionine synthase activation domain-containing protein [Bacteroidales bacterium]
MPSFEAFTPIAVPTSEIKVEEKQILRLLGYESDHIEPFISETIQRRIAASKGMIAARGGFIIRPVSNISPAKELLMVDNEMFHIGKIVASHLKRAEFVALFAVTIGKDLENHSEELFSQGEMLDGYVVNLIASEAAESAAAFIHHHISELAQAKHLHVTNRYSPGYCNWNVAEQFKLFHFFPESFTDISLTESALMNPVKSVSGIIGIGEHVRFNQYKCAICNDKQCIYRQKAR